jgi:hypothetical protein
MRVRLENAVEDETQFLPLRRHRDDSGAVMLG